MEGKISSAQTKLTTVFFCFKCSAPVSLLLEKKSTTSERRWCWEIRGLSPDGGSNTDNLFFLPLSTFHRRRYQKRLDAEGCRGAILLFCYGGCVALSGPARTVAEVASPCNISGCMHQNGDASAVPSLANFPGLLFGPQKQ